MRSLFTILLGPLVALTVSAGSVAGGDLSVVEAVKSGDIDTLRGLVKQGANVNARQGDGATALHWAAHRNDLPTADLLIRAGADVNLANELGATPLWLSCVNGSAAMVERLLDAGADPNLALSSGETPLMTAARSGDVNAVQLLLRHTANPKAKEASRGQTALMWAVDQKHSEVVQVLLQHGADVNERSDVWNQLENTAGNAIGIGDFEMAHGGSTPLLFAARTGDVTIARLLLDAGADVNDRSAAGTSALVTAAHSGHGELSAYLLERGADPNAADAGYTALHAAVLRGNEELVKALLSHGAEPNAVVQHGTPGRRFSADYSLRYQLIGANAIWLAARFGEISIMHVLAASGADPLVRAKDGTTALKAAMGVAATTENRRGRMGVPTLDPGEEERIALKAAQFVIDWGVDVDAANNAGDTALHDAARQGFNSVIQLLADRGANLNVKNKRNETPLAIADRRQPPDSGVRVLGNEDLRSTAELLRTLNAKE